MKLRNLVLTVTLASAAPSGLALAQEGSETSTPAAAAMPKKEIPPGFEPIAGKEASAESVSAPLLVIVAYGAFFLFMFGYVVFIVRSQAALGKEMKAIAEKIGRGQGS